MNPNRSKPTVGEILIAVTPAGRYRERQETKVAVVKVGRKYFTCDKHGDFEISTWRRAGCNVHANCPILLYRSEQDMLDEQEHAKLAELLSNDLRYRCDFEKLSLAQLRAIRSVLDNP